MIERARAKRQWERKLPPIDDPSQATARMAMLEAQELREWRVREDEIEALQQERLALLKQLLARRDETRKAELEYGASCTACVT